MSSFYLQVFNLQAVNSSIDNYRIFWLNVLVDFDSKQTGSRVLIRILRECVFVNNSVQLT